MPLKITAPTSIPDDTGYSIRRWGAFATHYRIENGVRVPVGKPSYDVVADGTPACNLPAVLGQKTTGPSCGRPAILEARFRRLTDTEREYVVSTRCCDDPSHLMAVNQYLTEKAEDVFINFRSDAHMDAEAARGRYLEQG
jgi:hypothetical protein